MKFDELNEGKKTPCLRWKRLLAAIKFIENERNKRMKTTKTRSAD